MLHGSHVALYEPPVDGDPFSWHVRGRRTGKTASGYFHAEPRVVVPTRHSAPRRVSCLPSGWLKMMTAWSQYSRMTTITPDGSGHPFRPGQILNPYPDHYSPAFAFSILLYPLPQGRALRFACRYLGSLIERQGIGLTTFPTISTRQLHRDWLFRAHLSPGG